MIFRADGAPLRLREHQLRRRRTDHAGLPVKHKPGKFDLPPVLVIERKLAKTQNGSAILMLPFSDVRPCGQEGASQHLVTEISICERACVGSLPASRS
jgi:hypothetical protein